MTCHKTSLDIDAAIERLTLRVDKTILYCRRFRELATAVDVWATHWSVEGMRRWLSIDDLVVEQKELVLVALALKGSADAGLVLQAYDAKAHGGEHERFWEVVRIEWESRYRDGGAGLSAAG